MFCSPRLVDAQIVSGLMLHLSFNKTVVDSSGNNFKVSSFNPASFTKDREGNDNCALLLNGKDDHVSITDMALQFPEEEVSIAFWARADQFASHLIYFLNPNSDGNRLSGAVM